MTFQMTGDNNKPGHMCDFMAALLSELLCRIWEVPWDDYLFYLKQNVQKIVVSSEIQLNKKYMIKK